MSSRTPDLSRDQLEKAVVALLKYVGHQQEESNNLLDEDDYIHLVCAAASSFASACYVGNAWHLDSALTGVLPPSADSGIGKDAYRAAQR